MAGLSTHVLDLASGRPAEGVLVSLERSVDDVWQRVGGGVTDGNGRIGALGEGLGSGVYRLVFATGEAGNPFFPEIHLVVDIDGAEEHYHVPLLLSPYGFTTYRGS